VTGLGRPIAECVRSIFPTPVAMHVWPDSEGLNAGLATLARAMAQAGPSAARSTIGGWRSGNDFMDRPEPCVRELATRAQTMVGEITELMMKPGKRRYHMEGWINLLGQGGYNSPHVHPNSTWSLVYYVTGNPPPATGDPGFSGKIELLDPRPGAAASYTVENAMQSRTLLNPQAGAMLVFPSWLQHQVHPYHGPGERISVAINVLVTAAA